jgi:hypothetical protein
MKRRGVAIIVVLFFAFSIAIILFFMISSNSNLANQNKQSLSQMQAYYLAHSGMQHAKLRLRLLPKETYEFFSKNGIGNPFIDVDSSMFPPTDLGNYNNKKAKYDLFAPDAAPDEEFPLGGRYHVESISLQGSHDSMKMVQDGYRIVVKSEIDGGQKKKFSDELIEEIIVSRFTGGIK